jgi:hypothetical protein
MGDRSDGLRTAPKTIRTGKWRSSAMIPNAVTRQSRARIAWRFSSGMNISIPKTVPSDDARQSPLVVIAKKT